MTEEPGDELLAGVVCGDIDVNDPRVVALLRAQPHRAEELAAARAAEAAVKAARVEATLRAARALPRAPGEERLPALLAKHVAGLTPGRAARRRFPLVLLGSALAAALLAAWWLWPHTVGSGAPGAPPQYLGSGEVRQLAPVGTVRAANWPAFHWQGSADSYQVVVYALGDGGRRQLFASRTGIVGDTWHPDDANQAKLATQTRIEWDLLFQDANGGGTVTQSASLQR